MGEKVFGKLLSIEGPDGSGKTTNVPYICDLLKDRGFDVLRTFAPGGSEVCMEMRKLILKTREDEKLVPHAELLMFMADRAQHIAAVIEPALAEGKIVVTDRYCDSTYAYQGAGRGLNYEYMQLEKMFNTRFPDFTLFFNVSLPESERRLQLRSNENNRFDNEKLEFKKRIHKGYMDRCRDNQFRMHILDAEKTIEEVQEDIQIWVDTKFVPDNAYLRKQNTVKDTGV